MHLPGEEAATGEHANAVGTFIKSRGHNENNEGSNYAYDTHGRTRSLWTEGIYENRLRPFTLSTGVQYSQRYSHNTYEGDAEATNDLHVSGLYLFSQLKGKIGRLSYVGGVGGSHRYYSQGATHQHFWLFRPKLTVSYALTDRLQARYGFELSQHVSQIALISDVSIKLNRLETLVGNPNLRPNRVTSHDLHLTYTMPRLTLDLQGYARLNANCNLEQYTRVNTASAASSPARSSPSSSLPVTPSRTRPNSSTAISIRLSPSASATMAI